MSQSKVYIRHVDAAPLSEAHIIALIDLIPSPTLQMLIAPAPASSLLWSLAFLRHDFARYAPNAWWRIDTAVTSAADGYVSQSSVLYTPEGQPAVFSRQLVAVFG